MAFEQKDNGGNENRPDYTGNCVVNGKEMRMAAWIKDGAKGKFMSLKFDEPQQAQGDGYRGSQATPAEPADDLDDTPMF